LIIKLLIQVIKGRPQKTYFQQNNCSELNETDIKCLQKNVYGHRRKTLPVNPTTIREVHEALVKSRHTNYEQKHIIIFSCQTNLKCINEVDTIYMDGTFKYCPRFFLRYNGHYIPQIFFV
jgi:hypothetical protein